MMNGRQFGYLTPENDGRYIATVPNQQIAGYSVGIVYIENINYPIIPGNVVNAFTYDFPVRMKAVPNLTNIRLFNADPTIKDDIIETAEHMVKFEGVRAICSACGFFGNYQKAVAEALDVPVAMSSLLQVPWIRTLLKPGKKIAILTASADSMCAQLFSNCGITDTSDLIIQGMGHTKEFSTVFTNTGHFDNAVARKEVVDAALKAVNENENIGAILLECSDMPPYAAYIQEAVQLPVFDFITLIKWLHSAVTQKPYSGWM